MNLLKHKNNTDVAMLVLELTGVQTNKHFFKVIWFNVVNKNRAPIQICSDEVSLSSFDGWKSYNHPSMTNP
jgi:hypothetical protein